MTILRPFEAIAVSVCLAALAAVVILPRWSQRLDPSKRPQLEGLTPDSIDVVIRQQQVGRLTNPEPLMALLRAGHPVHAHRCSYPGYLVMRFTNGTSTRILIRPGHTDASYEFTWTNGLFAVDRSKFLSVLSSAGVDTNTVPTPPK